MVTEGLLVRLEAKPGHEQEVERFLEGVMPTVEREPDTVALFALRLGPASFGIFNAFPDEAGRQAHIAGAAAVALSELAARALASPPTIEPVDILAAKLPGSAARPAVSPANDFAGPD
jgi:quinol monooxygenase YgiN